jgi:hypothetical protein
MKITHDFYTVPDGSATRQTIDEFVVSRKKAIENREMIRQKYGAKNIYGNSLKIIGLQFESGSPIPAGFRSDAAVPSDVFVPNTKTTEGQLVRLDFPIPLPDAAEFNAIITNGKYGVGVGLTRGGAEIIEYIRFEFIGEKVILIVPRNDKGEPGWTPAADCVKLKQSEFWKIVEDNEK